MKRRRRTLIVLFVLGLIVVIAFFLSADGEPKYKGRRLTEWVLLHEQATGAESVHNSSYDPGMLQESETAILAIGTNALPWLMKWIQIEVKPAPWRDRLAQAIDKMPGELRDKPPFDSWLASTDWDHLKAAEVAFDILGTNASPVVPELTDLLFCQKSAETCSRVSHALACIGGAGIPALLTAVENPAFPHRREVVWQLRQKDRAGTNLLRVVESLVAMVGDADEKVARKAAESLQCLGAHLDISVPALAKGLTDPRPKVRAECARALRYIGEPARSALPALLVARDDSDREVRGWATTAVAIITHTPLSPTSHTIETVRP